MNKKICFLTDALNADKLLLGDLDAIAHVEIQNCDKLNLALHNLTADYDLYVVASKSQMVLNFAMMIEAIGGKLINSFKALNLGLDPIVCACILQNAGMPVLKHIVTAKEISIDGFTIKQNPFHMPLLEQKPNSDIYGLPLPVTHREILVGPCLSVFVYRQQNQYVSRFYNSTGPQQAKDIAEQAAKLLMVDFCVVEMSLQDDIKIINVEVVPSREVWMKYATVFTNLIRLELQSPLERDAV